MSPSASSPRSASSPCGPCATKCSPGPTPPATPRARSSILWPHAYRDSCVRCLGPGRVRARGPARGGNAPPGAPTIGLPQWSRRTNLCQCALPRGRAETGHAEALRQIELAEESGNRSRLVHACYLGGGGTQLERRLRRGRRPRCTSRTTWRSRRCLPRIWPRWRSPGGLPAEPRTRLSRRSAPAAGSHGAAGNRWMHAFAVTEASGLLVSRGELEAGCAGLADMVGVWVPRRGLVTAVAHSVALCDRPRSDRPSRTRHRAVWCNREARHARRGADVEHSA